jgi:guanylate kinase
MDIDVQGAEQLRSRLTEMGIPATYLFISPPSVEELLRRLNQRRSEDEKTLESRLAKVQFELDQAELYDAVIVNDDCERTVRRIEEILGLTQSS